MLKLLAMRAKGQGHQEVGRDDNVELAHSLTAVLPRFNVRNMVESAAIRDISEASVYQGESAYGTAAGFSKLIPSSQSTHCPSCTSRSSTACRAPSTRTSFVSDHEKDDATAPHHRVCDSTEASRACHALLCNA